MQNLFLVPTKTKICIEKKNNEKQSYQYLVCFRSGGLDDFSFQLLLVRMFRQLKATVL